MNNPRTIIEYQKLITQLLLDNDGSTTVLLESLLNGEIHVNVTLQVISDETDDNHAKQQFLASLPHKPDVVIKRQTELLDKNNNIIAKALVYFDQTTKQHLSLNHTAEPLGKTLIQHQVRQFRQILSSGNCIWNEQNQQKCAYKEYLIYGDNNHILYVHERFNPDFIPSI